ncbi:MAG: IS200/IS605 family transposase [Candidatus Marinimicrobia bacterium]|nr:IS200/IS605 family transposase [Candidatus Neomarinimicrobiota bacterium]
MANTYSQIYIQVVFAVKYWETLIKDKYRVELEKYITGIVKNNNSKLLAIYCNPDHTHVLIGLNPDVSVSEISCNIKANSSRWINQNKWYKGTFRWQTGFGVFSYSRSQIDYIAKYILNQQEHHRRTSFKDEYLDLLNKAEIKYDEEYIFDWIE